MRYALAILLLSAACFAQTQGNAPQVRDGFLVANDMNGGTGACGATQNCVNFVEGVAGQDLIVCAANQEDATGCTGGSNPPWTFGDTAGFPWTMKGAINYGRRGQLGYACAASSQATYNVTWTGQATCSTPPSFNCVRFTGLCSAGAVTVDDYQTNTIGIDPSGTTNLSTSVTTTHNRDVIVAVGNGAVGNGGGSRIVPTGNLSFIAGLANEESATLSWQIAPTLGANSVTYTDYNAIHNSMGMEAIAFAVPAIKLGDSALPQGATSVAYSAQLHCYGGTSATPTYALVSGALPTGLSLNTSTGAITGTPSGTASATLGFTCTDGTSTSATDTLTLTVVSAFSTPSVSSSSQTSFNSNGNTTVSVACGDLIVIQVQASHDTHGTNGYKQIIDGTNVFVHHTDPSPVQQYQIGSGAYLGPNIMWVLGPITTSGADSISVSDNTASSSGLIANIAIVKGAQSVLDTPAINSTVQTGASASIAASYTTVVPNQLLLVSTYKTAPAAGNSVAFTFNSPLASIFTGIPGVGDMFSGFASGLVASPSTVSATTNMTETSATDALTTMAIALRPAGTATCAIALGPGEKIRRQVY